jgi:hypothetical protein
MLRGTRFQIRAIDTEIVHIAIKLVDEALCKFFGTGTLFIGAVDDLVIDIGEIPHKSDPVVAISQVFDNHVKDQRGARMSNMAVIIRGYTTDIELDMAGLNRV